MVSMRFPERAWGYRIACETGFRIDEVSRLTPESFNLDADTPTIALSASETKNRKAVTQPIRAEFSEQLATWLATKPKGVPLALLPEKKGAAMLAADLALARTTWIAESTSQHVRA